MKVLFMRAYLRKKAFTLVEILAVIAILAVIVAVIVPIAGNYVQMARETSDKQTLSVLNDALTRYKSQGGDIDVLTAGASIGHVLELLQTPVTWCGISHQFLKTGTTYPTRSLSAMGQGAWYRFFGYGSYSEVDESEIAMGTVTSDMPYGKGVGYAVGSVGANASFTLKSTTGSIAYQINSGAVNIVSGMAGTTRTVILPSGGNQLRIWSCANASDSSFSGSVTYLSCSNQSVQALDLSGLTGLQTLYCFSNNIDQLDVSGLVNLQNLDCKNNSITQLDVSNANLVYLNCSSNNITSTVDVRNSSALEFISLSNNPVSNVILGSHPNIETLDISDTNIGSLDVSGLSALQRLYMSNNNISSINVSSMGSLTDVACNYITYENSPSLSSVGTVSLYLTSANYATSPAPTTRTITMDLTGLLDSEVVAYMNSVTTTTYPSNLFLGASQTGDPGYAAAKSTAQSRGWTVDEFPFL